MVILFQSKILKSRVVFSSDLLRELIADLRMPARDDLDLMWMHEYAMSCDDIPLPHHISQDTEINRLVEDMKLLLKTLPHPRIITIAR